MSDSFEVLSRYGFPVPSDLEDFSSFDGKVRDLVSQGKNKVEIAHRLCVSYWRVRKSVERMGLVVPRGKPGRRRSVMVGDPDYDAELARRRARG